MRTGRRFKRDGVYERKSWEVYDGHGNEENRREEDG